MMTRYNIYCYIWEPAQVWFDTKKPKLILIIISTGMLTKNDDVKYNAYCLHLGTCSDVI